MIIKHNNSPKKKIDSPVIKPVKVEVPEIKVVEEVKPKRNFKPLIEENKEEE